MNNIQIGDKVFDIIIERKRIRNIYLRVKGDKLYVTCPFFITNFEILNFINSKRDWISKVNIKKNINSKLQIGNTIFYRGKEYKLVLLSGNKAVKVDEDNNTIYIRCKDANIDKAISAFYEFGKKVLLEDVYKVQDKYLRIIEQYGYNLIPEYHIKYLKSMWGVCYNRKNTVNLSVRLIHFDKETLEAILWHELLHFVIPNHSKRFHDVIDLYMPRYKEIIKKLK